METWTLILLLLLGAALINWQTAPVAKFTVVNRPWYYALMLSNPVTAVVDRGYREVIQVSQRPFQMRYWSHNYMILPLRYLTDVKRASLRHLSFFDNIPDVMFMSYWVGDLFASDRLVYVIKKGLNPQLPQVTQVCLDTLPASFLREVGDCKEPKEVVAMPALSNITQRTAALVIMGRELAQDDRFIRACQRYFDGNVTTGVMILKMPLGPLRPLVGRLLARFQRQKLANLISVISPVVDRRMKEREQDPVAASQNVDAIEWTLKLLRERPIEPDGSPALWRISAELIQNLWASGTSLGVVVTNMIFFLLEEPSSLGPLRAEAEAALAKHGWSESIINSLPLQDSFIREVNRVRPMFTIGCTRTIMDKPFQFSDGLELPAGARIGFPAGPSHTDTANFENPLKLDPFRFVRLTERDVRTEDGVNRWVASHMGATNLVFGYGNHACPGRFFAIRLIKLVFTRLIVEYDISWQHKGPGRPPPMEIEGLTLPCPTQTIWLQRRSQSVLTTQA